jgi:putative PEP-CTERM system histidine kinase
MVNIGAVSYVIGGLAFLTLAILLLTSWRGRLHGALIVAASVTSAIWCFVLAYSAATNSVPLVALLTLEVLRDGVWFTLLLALLGANERSRPFPQAVTLAAHGLWIAVLCYIPLVHFGLQPTGSPSAGNAATTLGPLVLALLGIVLVEQLYRNTHPEKRWAIKFLCIGVGGLFAYDLFLYSQGLLLREINANIWNARGAVNALVVPLIAVSAARSPEWSPSIFVSRHIVFYTAGLIGTGIYLLAMATGGYYVRAHGGQWGEVGQIIFLFGAGLLLLATMVSGQVRTELRVFLTKHFYRNKYDYREEWLRLINTLATPSEEFPLPERTIKAIAQIVASPGGALWIQDRDGHFRPMAQWHLAVPAGAVESLGGPFVRFLRERQWVVDLGEHKGDPARYDNLVLPDWLIAIDEAWLVIPLLTERDLLGFMVLARSDTFGRLTWEDTDLLKTVGQQLASYLGQYQAAQQLVEGKQFDAYNRLTAFLMHDLKNLIAQQSLVVKNAAKHKDNPAFIDDAIRTIDNSVRRMNRLLQQLKQGKGEGAPGSVHLAQLLSSTVGKHADMDPAPKLELIENGIDVRAESERLTMVISHLIRNAQEATPANGHVQVRLRREGENAVVEIIDDGCGMEPQFVRDRLFRPFDSTKGSKGMGIGAYQAREFIKSIGGELHVESRFGQGTTFRISLPAIQRGSSEKTQRRLGSGQ